MFLRDLSALRIVEIGGTPYVKRAFPEQTAFFSTFAMREPTDDAAQLYAVSLSTIPLLLRQLRSASLIVCHPTFFSPWHWRWLIRCFFDRRLLAGHFPLVRAAGAQFLRLGYSAPIAVLDHEDIPVINRNNLFLLDRAVVYFKRELPVDRWRLFCKTAHPNLPTPRFRKLMRQRERIAKIRPISLGLPRWDLQSFPQKAVEKQVDVFFAGLTEGSSTIRAAGLHELLSLRERGVSVDIPEGRLAPEEFYARCARARLTWSPEGLGWDCFRHYEAPMCGSVPLISRQTVERHQPLQDGEHAIYYDVEEGNLSRAVLAALSNRPRLAVVAEAARAHVLQYHTPQALAEYIVRTTLEQAKGAGAPA